MVNYYSVTLGDVLDRLERRVLIKGEEDLSNFLKHLDTKKYLVLDVGVITAVSEDKTEFLKNDTTLEKGE